MKDFSHGVTRRVSLRPAAVICLLGLAPLALANGAMGLALEVFDFRIWAVYVVATVVLEAWIVGRSMHHSWIKSVGLSTLFNFLTAFCCAAGFFAPALHPDRIELNPFLWTIEVLSFYGLVSALIEFRLWKASSRETMTWFIFKKTFLAHALGIPLALTILLIPSRPYPGLEADSNVWRFFGLIHHRNEIYNDRITDDGKVRQFASAKEFEQKLDEVGGSGVCLYNAVYRRFDFHDPRIDPRPFELNPKVSEGDPWAARIHINDQVWELNPFEDHWNLVKKN